jgi:hypothetical protein
MHGSHVDYTNINFRLWNIGLIGWTSWNFGAFVLQAYQEQELRFVDFRLCDRLRHAGLTGRPHIYRQRGK